MNEYTGSSCDEPQDPGAAPPEVTLAPDDVDGRID